MLTSCIYKKSNGVLDFRAKSVQIVLNIWGRSKAIRDGWIPVVVIVVDHDVLLVPEDECGGRKGGGDPADRVERKKFLFVAKFRSFVAALIKIKRKPFSYIRKFRRSSCKVIYEEGLLNIWGNAQIFSHSRRTRGPLQLLPSEFPYMRKISSFFYQCGDEVCVCLFATTFGKAYFLIFAKVFIYISQIVVARNLFFVWSQPADEKDAAALLQVALCPALQLRPRLLHLHPHQVARRHRTHRYLQQKKYNGVRGQIKKKNTLINVVFCSFILHIFIL